jgi:hypothetical protein
MRAEVALIRATQLAKDGKAEEAAGILDKESKQDQEKKLELKLAAVQLLLAEVSDCSVCNTLFVHRSDWEGNSHVGNPQATLVAMVTLLFYNIFGTVFWRKINIFLAVMGFQLCYRNVYFLFQGDRKEACQILQNLGEATFKPGIVSALVTLYLADGSRDGASRVLKDAVDWYRKNKVCLSLLNSNRFTRFTSLPGDRQYQGFSLNSSTSTGQCCDSRLL